MASNYECAMCGTGSDGNLSFCTVCGDNGTIIYTGKKDREVEQARLQRRRQEEEASAKRLKHEELAKKKQEKEVKRKQKHIKNKNVTKTNTSQADEDFSPVFFCITAIAVGFSLYKPEDENGVAALIVASLAGSLAGKFYKAIIGIAIAVVILYIFNN